MYVAYIMAAKQYYVAKMCFYFVQKAYHMRFILYNNNIVGNFYLNYIIYTSSYNVYNIYIEKQI